MYKTIEGYVENVRIVVLLALITAFALVAMCASALAITRHYYPNPPIPFETRAFLNDSASPCYWETTQHGLIYAVLPSVFNKKFDNQLEMIVWATRNEIPKPIITNARVIGTGTYLTCSAGMQINNNLIEVAGPESRNQIRYKVHIKSWERKIAVIQLIDENFIKHGPKFYTASNYAI